MFGDRVIDVQDQERLQRGLYDACRDKIRDDLNIVLKGDGLASHPQMMLERLRWCDLF